MTDAEMSDFDREPTDGLKRASDTRHRFLRFDPTVSTGTLLQIGALVCTVAVGYSTYREDRVETKASIDAVKATAGRDREEMTKAVESFRSDLKELKTKMDGVGENIAVLKAQKSSR